MVSDRLFTAEIESPVGLLYAVFSDSALLRLEFSGGTTRKAESSPAHVGAGKLEAPIRRQLNEYFGGRRREFEINLLPKGTPFQARVWDALRRIPYGSTVTYGSLAGELASNARAVGGACARNPISIVIPCHRVVGGDGGLRGFGGGLAAKRFLLDLEGAGSGQQHVLFK
jgi:methylated-DNA-[protein]-cysteine S-methyltransferase